MHQVALRLRKGDARSGEPFRPNKLRRSQQGK